MRYRKLGNSRLEVSVVGLGTWVLGGDHWGKTDDNQSIATIRKAIDVGINLIDTAPAYGEGHAEEITGRAIKGLREKVVIATKCGVHRVGKEFKFILKPEEIRKELEHSLRRLDIETIDLYQCHWPDPDTPIEDTMAEMLKMKDEGKIRYIGVSNFEVPLLRKAIAAAPVVSLQPHYSLLERKIEKEILPFCREKEVGILAYGSLGSGILTGKYRQPPQFKKGDARSFFYPFYKEPYWSRTQELLAEMRKVADRRGKPNAQVAINWVNQQEGVTSALVGARTPDQSLTNAGAGEWELSKGEVDSITLACDRIFAD
jgi:aryl-alcohol dehydrogenase-like predicted oxidoreductase